MALAFPLRLALMLLRAEATAHLQEERLPFWTTVGLPNSRALLSSAPCSVHKALPQLVIQGAAAVAEVQGIPSRLVLKAPPWVGLGNLQPHLPLCCLVPFPPGAPLCSLLAHLLPLHLSPFSYLGFAPFGDACPPLAPVSDLPFSPSSRLRVRGLFSQRSSSRPGQPRPESLLRAEMEMQTRGGKAPSEMRRVGAGRSEALEPKTDLGSANPYGGKEFGELILC
ncbi:uncharacterized protein LOC130684521 [Manis pentadactyla]|uniref:uncharacterized protein LOC130684521 n=1 Tax=Manis pentadactyla TaxID=143292 RepID=UPI00255C7D21|nr:uncharacterized protein LOC130684521 [Manis pentadactyla]